MKILRAAVGFLISLFFIFALLPEASAQQSRDITLAGYKMQPKVATSGSGSATVKLKGDTLTVEGEFKNLTEQFSGGYIMVDLQGHPGNQIHRLKAQLNEEKTGGTLQADENRFGLSEGQKELLQKGDLFIVISSYQHRKGELRADIPPMKGN